MRDPEYPFLRRLGRILNSGQSRSVVLTGNVYDLFYLEKENEYVSLIDFLCAQWELPGVILVVYEINGPIRFLRESDRDRVRSAWLKWRTGLDENDLAIERMLSSKNIMRSQTC